MSQLTQNSRMPKPATATEWSSDDEDHFDQEVLREQEYMATQTHAVRLWPEVQEYLACVGSPVLGRCGFSDLMAFTERVMTEE